MGKFYRRVAAVATAFALGWAALGVATPAAAAASCQTYFKTYNTVRVGTKGTQTKAAQCLIQRAKRQVLCFGMGMSQISLMTRLVTRTVERGVTVEFVMLDPIWLGQKVQLHNSLAQYYDEDVVKAVESRVAANMVAINVGSWLTNIIPITQGYALLGTKDILTGMQQTLAAMKESDGMVEASAFLTNRIGSDPLVQTWAQKASARMLP